MFFRTDFAMGTQPNAPSSDFLALLSAWLTTAPTLDEGSAAACGTANQQKRPYQGRIGSWDHGWLFLRGC
jgi:hypothetical protein